MFDKYFYIYTKLYKTFGRIRLFEKLFDRMFVAKKTHRLQMFMYPLAFFVTHPTLATYRSMLKVSPNLTRKLKQKMYKK